MTAFCAQLAVPNNDPVKIGDVTLPVTIIDPVKICLSDKLLPNIFGTPASPAIANAPDTFALPDKFNVPITLCVSVVVDPNRLPDTPVMVSIDIKPFLAINSALM